MSITVDTKSIYHPFASHLEKNERILFSGGFGTGKSTFLTEYFNSRSDCNVFKIYPVSYSVSNNEDIFELIKYDILFSLIENHSEDLHLVNEDYSNILSFQFRFLFQAKWSPILFKLIEFADKTGRISALEKIIDEVKSQYKEFKAKFKDEEEDIYQYLFKEISKKGSPRENDSITNFIRDLLSRLKENTKYRASPEDENEEFEFKKNVLIIDDLDRLDPEHIFRLFNIFSVNFGSCEIENKFGFDKIIFVCDVKNIREIYAHKYGRITDFEGYIDKFYSSAPFEFNTNKLLHNYIKDIMQSFLLPENAENFNEERNLEYNPTYVILKAVFNSLLEENKINLRSLLNNTEFHFDENTLELGSKNKNSNLQYSIYIVLFILKQIYDTSDYLKEVFIQLQNIDKSRFRKQKGIHNIYNDDAYKMLVEECLPFLVDYKELDPKLQEIRFNETPFFKHLLPELNLIAEFRVGESRNSNFRGTSHYFSFEKFVSVDDPNIEVDVKPFRLLSKVLDKINSLNSF